MTRSSVDSTQNSPSVSKNRTAQWGDIKLWGLFQIIARQYSKMPPVRPVQQTDPRPLSFAQERLEMLHQFEAENLVYNVSVIRRLKGSLNIAALEQGINEIIRRHEVLRTVLPAQDLLSDWEQKLPMTDCRSFPEPEIKVRGLISRALRQPFDLTQGPFLRPRLFQLDSEDYVLLLLMHQICCDDQSKGIFMQELSVLYDAFSTGKPSPLPELPVQYADFAHWQRQWLQGDVLEKHSVYWREQLSGRLPRLNLSAHSNSEKITQHFETPPHLLGSLKALSRREDLTFSITLLAIFQTLLFHCTRQDDMLVFSSFGGRNRSEVKPLIGLFANILLLRTDMSGNPSFLELLSRVRETMFGAIVHQDMPFDQLLEMLHSETGQTPSFQVLFVFQNTALPDLCFSDLKTEPFKVDADEASHFDLILYCQETAQEGLTGWLQYREGVCEAAPYMAEIFQTLLAEIAEAPEQQLLKFPCLAHLPQSENEVHTIPDNLRDPDDALELELLNIWRKKLQLDLIGTEDNFFDLGGNSLLAVALFAEIEKKLNRQLSVTMLLKAPTVKQLAEMLKEEGCSPPRTSLIPVQPCGGRPPFFYVPAGGKTALSAVPYARHLGADQPVYGVQPTGFGEGEESSDRVEDMAAYYVQEIRNFQTEGPYYLGGPCFGAYMAFETARQLQAQGCTVGLLAMFDPPNPHVFAVDRNGYEKAGYYIRKFYYYFKCGQLLPALMEFFIYSRVYKVKNKLSLLKSKVLQQDNRIDRVLDAHIAAMDKYIPQFYPGKITLFENSEYQAIEAMEAKSKGHQAAKSWTDFATDVESRVIQGRHLEIFQEPRFQQLVEELKACLNEAQAQHSSTTV